ncbi:alpha/beta fold hydrolase [Microbacterium sp. 179-I 3D4 NHS]|uniref:alpha/beta fold hydrolase n=1 Tax=Microbacterium sp. 179-I 3D4 NHS TaxID=3142381 RepID=UPI0039A226AC
MATFALIHGGGSSGWDWHRVTPLLERLGHEAVAVDLPTEDADAGLDDYVRTVADAVGDRGRVIVVGHSLGGFTAPLAAEALGADGLVYLSAMIPLPGEVFMDWWENTGHDREDVPDDPEAVYYNDVSAELAAEARAHERDQQGTWLSEPWPGERYPDVPTMGIVCTEDRFFPPEFMRRLIRGRLGIEPVEMPGGHYAALTQPEALASLLDDFARRVGAG